MPALMLGALVSQALSRRLLPHNFYDGILVQDGHRVEHLVPPQDLAGWQQRRVSAVATREPVLALSLDEAAIQTLLRDHPYERFPVWAEGKLLGVLTRAEARAAQAEKRLPLLAPAVCCASSTRVREVQHLLLESPTGLLVVCEEPDGLPMGVVTLHDLLRAEISLEKTRSLE